MDLLTVTTRTEGEFAIVAASGEIDMATVPALQEKISELVAAGRYQIVVDLTGVEFIDSTGLGALVGALKQVLVHDGSLRLVITQPRMLELFEITALTEAFRIDDSLEAALSP